MITGDKTRRVARYLPIDHCGEGYGWVRPDDGKIIKTVNALDLSEIEFAEGES